MSDRVESIGVYVDDRVRTERWVRRLSIDTSTVSSMGSLAAPEESDTLQADVNQLLDVCKRSKRLIFQVAGIAVSRELSQDQS